MANTTLTPTVGAAVIAGALAGNYPSTATLYLTEFETLMQHPLSSGFPHCPSVAASAIPYGAVSAVSSAFSSQTRLIRVHSTGIAALNVGGLAPVAAAGINGNSWRIGAGVAEYFSVKPGDALAVIATT